MQCVSCKRLFVSKKAMAQHQRDKHPTDGPPPAKKLLNNNRSRRRRRRAGGTVSLNPSLAPRVRGETTTLSGEDRLDMFTAKRSQTTVVSYNMASSMSLRLSHIAKAYQRIQWLSLTVTVTPQVSVVTNGGYVCGFIMDPSDESVTARQLSAVQGSTTKKWYESCRVSMPRKLEVLYTSDSEEKRLSIPAKFWLITEGQPSNDVPVVLTVNWRVKLMEPTIETGSSFSFVTVGDIISKPNNYNTTWKKPDGTKTDDFSEFVPPEVNNIKGLTYFRVPTFTVEYAEGTGDTGTIQCHFIAYDSGDKKMYFSQNGTSLEKNTWQSDVDVQTLVPCGVFCKYVGSGNVCRGVGVVPPSSNSSISRPSYQVVAAFYESFRRLMITSNDFSTPLMDDFEELNTISEENLTS